MIAQIKLEGEVFIVDLNQGVDISLSITDLRSGPNCFGARRPVFTPMKGDNWIARVAEGGSVNAMDVQFNPHGNGTHTECLGHISESHHRLPELLKEDWVLAHLLTTTVMRENEGIQIRDLPGIEKLEKETAVVIRTLPNSPLKREMDYTGTQPTFLSVDVVRTLVEKGIKHLMVDLPSVDPENDGGTLSAHKEWWNWPTFAGRQDCTITELVYIPNEVEDGRYFLNLQRASFDLDCSPSRPVLFKATKKEIRKTS